MMKFKVNGQIISVVEISQPVADSVDYLTARFEFSDDWGAFPTRTAYFQQGLTRNAYVLSNNAILSPGHLNLTEGKWDVSVVGIGSNNTKVTTNTAAVRVLSSGINGGTSVTISATESEQIVAKVSNIHDVVSSFTSTALRSIVVPVSRFGFSSGRINSSGNYTSDSKNMCTKTAWYLKSGSTFNIMSGAKICISKYNDDGTHNSYKWYTGENVARIDTDGYYKITVTFTDSTELTDANKQSLFDLIEFSACNTIPDHPVDVYPDVATAKERAIGRAGDIIDTLGFYASGDGGGARYVISDSGTADGIFVHATKWGQYLNLQYGDTLNVLACGMKPYTDSADKFDNKDILTAISGNNLLFPSGNYYVSTDVTISKYVTWKGEFEKRNGKVTVLVFDEDGIIVQRRRVTIENITIQRSVKSRTNDIGLLIKYAETTSSEGKKVTHSPYVTLRNVKVTGFSHGVYADNDCFGLAFYDCAFEGCGNGITIKNDNHGSLFSNCYLHDNNYGFVIDKGQSNALTLESCIIQDNVVNNIRINTNDGVQLLVEGCHIENHSGVSVSIGEEANGTQKVSCVSFVGSRFYSNSSYTIGDVTYQNPIIKMDYVHTVSMVGCVFNSGSYTADTWSAISIGSNTGTVSKLGNYPATV